MFFWWLIYVASVLVFLCVLGMVFYLLSFLVGISFLGNREKCSVYECGFEPMMPTRISFSLRFFLIAVIFLVFDVEVVFLFTFVFSVWCSVDWVVVIGFGMFLSILSLGLFHEWRQGSLDWEE